MRQYTLPYEPSAFEQLVNGLFRVFYNVEKSSETITTTDEEGHETSETHDIWLCNAVDIEGPMNESAYARLVSAIIRDKYTVDDELALERHARKGDHAEEIAEHDDFAEAAKNFAKSVLGMD